MLADFLVGRTKAERVVAVVADAYYRERARGTREALQPVMDVIERAAPGVVDLARTEGGAGFAIRLAERPFPKPFEAQLRQAAEAVLAGTWGRGAAGVTSDPDLGFWSRVLRTVRRLFSASA